MSNIALLRKGASSCTENFRTRLLISSFFSYRVIEKIPVGMRPCLVQQESPGDELWTLKNIFQLPWMILRVAGYTTKSVQVLSAASRSTRKGLSCGVAGCCKALERLPHCVTYPRVQHVFEGASSFPMKTVVLHLGYSSAAR